jgi:putative transcriptional regulator
MPTQTQTEALPPISEAEIMAGALSDPDNPPLTEADLARLKPLPKARALRLRLRLTQEEFAARYHIPLGTLRDWEQRRAEPDRTAQAYLSVIAAEPEAAARALERKGAA